MIYPIKKIICSIVAVCRRPFRVHFARRLQSLVYSIYRTSLPGYWVVLPHRFNQTLSLCFVPYNVALIFWIHVNTFTLDFEEYRLNRHGFYFIIRPRLSTFCIVVFGHVSQQLPQQMFRSNYHNRCFACVVM